MKMIISPHVDDEVLGCGGILDSNTFVLHCGLAVSQNHGNKIISSDFRNDEFKQIADMVGLKYNILSHPVNRYNVSDLISDFESYIGQKRPDEIYIPHPSYNQDHRAVYEAALTALRPHDINFFVKRVFVYEQPHVFFWDHNYGSFDPNYFVEIDIEKKLKLYNFAGSQVRSFRSPDHIKAIAKARGGQCLYDYAEAFQIIRWVD